MHYIVAASINWPVPRPEARGGKEVDVAINERSLNLHSIPCTNIYGQSSNTMLSYFHDLEQLLFCMIQVLA
jgi:hypothetical protein